MRKATLEIVGLYVLMAGAWVLLSDQALLWLVKDPDLCLWMQTYKGWSFVLITAALLYVALSRRLKLLERAQDAQKQLMERLQQYLSASPVISYALRIENNQASPIWVSENITGILGYTMEELLQPSWWDDHLHPDDRKEAQAKVWSSFFETGTLDHKYRFLCKDGTVIWIQDQIRLVRDESGTPREAIGVWTNITELKLTEEKLRKRESFIRAVLDNLPIGVAVNSIDPHVVFGYMNDLFPRFYRTTRDAITDPDTFWNAVYEDPEFREKMQKQVRDDYASGDPARLYWPDVPITRRGSETTYITARNITIPGEGLMVSTVWDVTERKRLELERQVIIDKLRLGLAATVQTVSAVVEARDPYTAGHQRRVSDLARAIAREMGLPDDQIEGIRVAGIIHDIGKISVPSEILSKPSKLSPVEFRLIQVHPEAGYEILKDVEFPWPVARTVLQHHERMDGSGYPNGLRGEDIILEARILAVADVVESMASHRPYRPTLGLEAALDEIAQHRGSRYDTVVVDACATLFRDKEYQLPS
ncbi:MAG: HD domain-containing phosphohydrolase [Syntrophales bacterium]